MVDTVEDDLQIVGDGGNLEIICKEEAFGVRWERIGKDEKEEGSQHGSLRKSTDKFSKITQRVFNTY